MSWFAVVRTLNGQLLPITAPDSYHIATWRTNQDARDAVQNLKIVQAYGAKLFEFEDGEPL